MIRVKLNWLSMESCTFTSRIGAFHDGELPADLRQRLESHLESCAACREEAEALSLVSGVFRQPDSQDLTPLELARLRQVVCRSVAWEESPIRLFGGLLAVAASIIIVCGAWWHAAPPAAPPQTWSVSETPEWERTAMNLRTDGEPVVGRDATTDPNLADWMVTWLSNQEDRREPAQN